MSESYPFVYGASGSIALAVKANVNFFTSKLHSTVEKKCYSFERKGKGKTSQKYKMRLNGIKLNVNF